MIVDFSDFKFEAKIPILFPKIGTDDAVNEATRATFKEFMEKYELIYLLQFFPPHIPIGSKHAPHIPPFGGAWGGGSKEKKQLIKSLKSIIPNFIAFYWFRNETIQNTGIGAVIPQGQNAIRTNNADRMERIWNEMVDNTRYLYKAYFPKYNFPDKDIFKKINLFGI